MALCMQVQQSVLSGACTFCLLTTPVLVQNFVMAWCCRSWLSLLQVALPMLCCFADATVSDTGAAGTDV